LYVGRSTFSPYSKLVNGELEIHNVHYMPNYVSGNKSAVFRLVATINCLSTEVIEIRVETGLCSF
jgi:hypothetical protein